MQTLRRLSWLIGLLAGLSGGAEAQRVVFIEVPGGSLGGLLLSGDGQTIYTNIARWRVGEGWWYWRADGSLTRNFNERWTANQSARGVSYDGRVIVGEDYNYYIPHPFRWVEGRGVEYPFGGAPRDVSFDGRVVVGGGPAAFRWVEEVGLELLLPFQHYSSEAASVSWDGRVAVGTYRWDEYDYTARSFWWREGVGWQDLREAFAELWPEWVEEVEVYELSADGRYMVGLVYDQGYRFKLFWLDTGRLGDVDGNGCVDDGDLLEVLFNFGASGMNLRGDLNRDGAVDETDLLEVLLHFGEGC